jgi:DNA-binding NarL/FixJ family response regulator
VVAAMFREAAGTDVHDLLPSVRTPTLVIHRQSDRQMPREVSAGLAAALPNGRLVEPPGDRPALFLEGLASDVRLVADFVADGRVTEVAAAPAAPDPSGLTPREREVLRLLAGGGTNAAIARSLDITEHTVERHAANLYRKIGARGRAEATAYAVRHGYA